MTRQRQILVTITYNDLGCIIDTKAEPYEEPNIKTLTPKEFVGELSPISLYSVNEWNNITLWLNERGYVICRKENR